LLGAVLGILKAGGAYLPLDPSYPAERLSFILEDGEAVALVTQSHLVETLPRSNAHVVTLDRLAFQLQGIDAGNLGINLTPDRMAYLIYTSGSTGLPKGVMVEHGNVASFFVGMDERIPRKPGAVWLALTTLSFDISVLELLWTLCRGLTVLVSPDQDQLIGTASDPTTTPIEFSLFYFSADQGEDPHDKYRLLREGAIFADGHGFSAVWTPERHFHEFGGLYPNPSVTSAALAMITEHIRIRSGSVVAPLHSPIRIAEEWSVVDNLSGGRVDLAFASGWMPDDFAIRREDYADRKQATFRHVDAVRSLWRGESRDFPGPDGAPISVRTLPRPLQPELPVWITAAGNPETFTEAGRMGAHLLTHLLGQTLEEVRDKVAVYRKAWREAGHPENGHVSLMVHTFVTDSFESARTATRGPLREYLRTSANLLRGYSDAFPTFRTHGNGAGEINFGDLPPGDLDELLDFAVDRYFETSGLFGTPESCRATIEQMKAYGIDEVACLIDFGVPANVVLDNLAHLNALKELATPVSPVGGGIADLIARHSVTHLQCTPTMAQVLLADPEAKAALRRLDVMMVGGEACPASLADELSRTVDGRVMNMYGPTETTIWSTTHDIRPTERSVPIGRPIRNTRVYVTNRAFESQPVGVAGELLIGGPGVTRGYLKRPELTAERFIPNPFLDEQAPRVYRTGDLVRYLPDGSLEFLGRIDHQVKIRGHRIELGEIEAVLVKSPAVCEAVVAAPGVNDGDRRLVAYVTLHEGREADSSELRHYLQERLPPFMVPAHIVNLDAFPLTPNKKIDRKALPAPNEVARPAKASAPPVGEVESKIAAIWADVLGVGPIGRSDDFFDLGGDSLSLIRVTSRLGDIFGQKVSVGTFVRSPTVKDVAALIADSSQGVKEPFDEAVGFPRGTASRPMRPEDLKDVVTMHLRAFPDWRSSVLGRRFVRKMYEWYLHEHGDLALVATREGRVVGFTVGTVGSYRASLLRFTSGELLRSMLRHPIRRARFQLRRGERDGADTRGPNDASVANNRIMAAAPGSPDAGLTLLMAFEAAATRRGVEAFFHDQDPGRSRRTTD
jgi:natural product biosynthesis luciferase-like monooxygenase protein